MKFKVKIDNVEKNTDNSFEVIKFELLEDRSWITKAIVRLFVSIILIYFLYGIYNDDTKILDRVIDMAETIIVFILGYYYDKQRQE